MNVPYYDRRIPEEYFQNAGWRGGFIIWLNRLRWRLERYVEFRVMLFVARRHQLEDGVVEALRVRFNEESEERLEGGRRKRSLAALGLVANSPDRYTVGRKNSPEPDVDQTTDHFARLMSSDRTKRYTRGRDHDEAFELDSETVDSN